MQFKDVERKIAFYKQEIIKKLIKNSDEVTQNKVNEELAKIDLKLPILKMEMQVGGSLFDVQKANYILSSIYNDLKILFEVVQEIQEKELAKIKDNINNKVRLLEDKTEFVKSLAQIESKTTTLGKTLLFKNFWAESEIKKNVEQNVYSCGSIKIKDGSKIACIVNQDDASLESTKILLTSANQSLELNNYLYNKTDKAMPGIINKKEFNISLSPIKRTGAIALPDIVLDLEKKYVAFAGKNKFSVQTQNKTYKYIVTQNEAQNANTIKQNSVITFYTVGATRLKINSNMAALYKNFEDGQPIKNIQFFLIECEPEFAFNVETDGTIFAAKEECILLNNAVCFPYDINTNDFLVYELSAGQETEYKVEIITNSVSTIDNIIIKEIDEFGGVVE